MPWMKAGMCCAVFYVEWGVPRCGDDWLVCIGVWEFREPNAESGIAGPPCAGVS